MKELTGNKGSGSGLEQNPMANNTDDLQFHSGGTLIRIGLLHFFENQQRLLQRHLGSGQFMVANGERVNLLLERNGKGEKPIGKISSEKMKFL